MALFPVVPPDNEVAVLHLTRGDGDLLLGDGVDAAVLVNGMDARQVRAAVDENVIDLLPLGPLTVCVR